MIETAPWGDDSATIEKQIMTHNKNHSSIQRSQEVDRARDDLVSDLSLPLYPDYKIFSLLEKYTPMI